MKIYLEPRSRNNDDAEVGEAKIRNPRSHYNGLPMMLLTIVGFALSKDMHASAFAFAPARTTLRQTVGEISGGKLSPIPATRASRLSRGGQEFCDWRRPVSVSSDMEVGSIPELGKDDIYHIQNEEEHRALLAAHPDKLVVMKVFAPWCRACKGLEPKFKAIVKDKKYADLPIIWADLTIQHNKDYVKAIGVLALPTVQFYVHGQRADTFPCGPSKVPILKRKLAQFVNQHVDAKTYTVKPAEEGGLDVSLLTPPGAGAAPVSADKKESTPPSSGTVDSVSAVVEREKSNLRSIPYFKDMLESEFTNVISKANLLTFESGSIIMREGNMGRTFYVILEGDVEICQRTSFEDPLTTPPSYLGTVINRFEKGEYFGERALVTGEPRAASIRASSRTKCLAFDKDDFPATSLLSGKVGTMQVGQDLNSLNDKYGITLNDMSATNDLQYVEAVKASQVRGSPNSPRPIDGVDNDKAMALEDGTVLDDSTSVEASKSPGVVDANEIYPILIRLKLIRSVARCFDYILANRPRFGEEGARRRRRMLINLLTETQKAEIENSYKLIDLDGDGEITLLELRRVLSSIGEEKSDKQLMQLIETSHQAMDGKQVITHEDFVGLMAESEFYHLFLETFRALDERNSGYVRAKDLDRVLCGVRDLITDDRRSIIDVDDTEMMVDYEQFSKMLLGSALN